MKHAQCCQQSGDLICFQYSLLRCSAACWRLCVSVCGLLFAYVVLESQDEREHFSLRTAVLLGDCVMQLDRDALTLKLYEMCG